MISDPFIVVFAGWKTSLTEGEKDNIRKEKAGAQYSEVKSGIGAVEAELVQKIKLGGRKAHRKCGNEDGGGAEPSG